MQIPGFVELKNIASVEAWRWRWARRGGSMHFKARALVDLRNDEDLRRWREIEVQRARITNRVLDLSGTRVKRNLKRLTA